VLLSLVYTDNGAEPPQNDGVARAALCRQSRLASDVWHTPDHYGSDLFNAIHGMPS
jgi:hypothetical protein